MNIYLRNCQKCKKETRHKLESLSRKRGAKTRCLQCGYVSLRYIKANLLKEVLE